MIYLSSKKITGRQSGLDERHAPWNTVELDKRGYSRDHRPEKR